MKAIRFMAPETIEVSDIPMPVCKDDEVIAKIAYAGFCATDIELLTGEMVHIKNGNTTYPLVPGHEWAGTIVAVGSKVRDLKVGDQITSDVSLGCGECDYCREGRYNLCPNREVVGSYRNRQGAFAEHIAVPQRHVYKVPENLSLEEEHWLSRQARQRTLSAAHASRQAHRFWSLATARSASWLHSSLISRAHAVSSWQAAGTKSWQSRRNAASAMSSTTIVRTLQSVPRN